MKDTERIFGLDLLRSAAILIVVLGHSGLLMPHCLQSIPFGFLPDGVDLFFVLSGFLIGRIIIKAAEKHQKFDFLMLINFLQRRWFRTLPNYFLFLLINIILIHYGLIKGFLNKFLVTYFFFFQNFYKPFDFLFWESWTLSVEEWFYLSFPMTLLILFLISKSSVKTKIILLIAVVLFLLLPLSYRIFLSDMSVEFSTWDLYFRKLVLTRMDTIGFGLAGAYVKFYRPAFWKSIKVLAFTAGIIILAALPFATIGSNTFYSKTFYFSLVGFAILLLLPMAASITKENIPYQPFKFISKISYSMYLVHLPLLQIVAGQFTYSAELKASLIYIMYWGLLVFLSFLVYRFFENPVMNIREKILIK